MIDGRSILRNSQCNQTCALYTYLVPGTYHLAAGDLGTDVHAGGYALEHAAI